MGTSMAVYDLLNLVMHVFGGKAQATTFEQLKIQFGMRQKQVVEETQETPAEATKRLMSLRPGHLKVMEEVARRKREEDAKRAGS